MRGHWIANRNRKLNRHYQGASRSRVPISGLVKLEEFLQDHEYFSFAQNNYNTDLFGVNTSVDGINYNQHANNSITVNTDNNYIGYFGYDELPYVTQVINGSINTPGINKAYVKMAEASNLYHIAVESYDLIYSGTEGIINHWVKVTLKFLPLTAQEITEAITVELEYRAYKENSPGSFTSIREYDLNDIITTKGNIYTGVFYYNQDDPYADDGSVTIRGYGAYQSFTTREQLLYFLSQPSYIFMYIDTTIRISGDSEYSNRGGKYKINTGWTQIYQR